MRAEGFSAHELWTQRDLYTGNGIDIRSESIVESKYKRRVSNHAASEKAKCPLERALSNQMVGKGDVVYINSECSKLQPQDRYLVVDSSGRNLIVRKFVGAQFRSRPYTVKRSDCYKVHSECVSKCFCFVLFYIIFALKVNVANLNQ